jgi:hypothetical protein
MVAALTGLVIGPCDEDLTKSAVEQLCPMAIDLELAAYQPWERVLILKWSCLACIYEVHLWRSWAQIRQQIEGNDDAVGIRGERNGSVV